MVSPVLYIIYIIYVVYLLYHTVYYKVIMPKFAITIVIFYVLFMVEKFESELFIGYDP